MESLFSMSVPWYEFLVRAIAVYVAVLVLVRIVGKRTVGQYTPFDLVVVVLLGTAVQNSLISDDTSLVGGLILAATLLGLNWLVGFISARWKLFDSVVEGQPVVLVRHGKVFDDELRRQSLTLSDLEIAMREAGCQDISEVDLAMLETSGDISVVKC
ncbi:DUF421 domain-containing protein [Luteimonas sp. A478]